MFFDARPHDERALAGFAVNQTFMHEVVDGAPHRRAAQVIAAHQLVLGGESIAGFVDTLGDVFTQCFRKPLIKRGMAGRAHGGSKMCILALVHYLT